jgi:hypothetical protein
MDTSISRELELDPDAFEETLSEQSYQASSRPGSPGHRQRKTYKLHFREPKIKGLKPLEVSTIFLFGTKFHENRP